MYILKSFHMNVHHASCKEDILCPHCLICWYGFSMSISTDIYAWYLLIYIYMFASVGTMVFPEWTVFTLVFLAFPKWYFQRIKNSGELRLNFFGNPKIYLFTMVLHPEFCWSSNEVKPNPKPRRFPSKFLNSLHHDLLSSGHEAAHGDQSLGH